MVLESLYIVTYQTLLLLPLMLGGYYSIVLMRLPDLALEAAFLMGATTSGLIAAYLYAVVPLSILLFCCFVGSFVGGIFVGYITSLLREKLMISHLFASIISIGFCSGICRALLGTTHFSLLNVVSPLSCLSAYTFYSEQILLFILGVIIFLLHVFLLSTEFGLSLEIYGLNKLFFQHHHINVFSVGYRGIMLAHGLAGVSGYYIAQSQYFVDCSMGTGIGLQVITALLFGIICAEKLNINRLYQPIAGIFCYFFLHALIIMSNFNLTYFNALQAIVVALCCLYRNQYLAADHSKTRYEIGV